MASNRTQVVSIGVALSLALALLWGAVFRLQAGRQGLERRLEEETRRQQELDGRLRDALARSERQAELLGTVDLAREAAEVQRAEARHGLFLAHVEAAALALQQRRLHDFDRHAALVPEEHRGWGWRHLQSRRQQAVLELPHDADVTALTAGADGVGFATASRDGLVRIYRANGEVVDTIDVGEEVSALAFDPEVEQLAIGTDGGALEIWDHDERESVARADWDERVTAVAFRPRSELYVAGLVVGLFDGTTWIWSGDDEDEPVQLEAHAGPVNAVAVAADGLRAATGSDDTTIHLLTGPLFAEARSLTGHEDWVRALDLRGSRLLSGSDDRTLRVWDLVSEAVLTTETFAETLVAAGFGAGGASQAVAADGQAVVGGQDVQLPRPAERFIELAAVDPGGRWLVYSTGDDLVCLWRAEPPAWTVLSIDLDAATVAFASGAERLVTGCRDGLLRILDGTTGAVAHVLAREDEAPPAVAITADGRLVAAGGRDGVDRLGSRDGRLLGRFETPETRVQSVAFTRDGEHLVAVSREGQEWLWNVRAGALVHTTARPEGFVFAVEAARDGQRFAWVGDAGTLRMWDARTGERLAALRERTLGRVDVMALSTDGARLVLVSNDHEVVSFDLAQSRLLARARDSERSFRRLAVDPAGDRFVTGSAEGAVHVWDTASCTPLLELVDGGPAITSLTFSPDGTQLAVALAGGELRIFEAP